MERSLNGNKFTIKEGLEKEYKSFVNSVDIKKIGKVNDIKKELKEFIDPLTAVLVIGGVAWAISKINAEKLKRYIEVK